MGAIRLLDGLSAVLRGLIVLFFVGLGVGALVHRHRYAATASWPAVKGRVLSSRVVQDSKGRGGWQRRADIVYSYAVGGIERRGETESRRAPPMLLDEHAARFVARHPEGAEVAVFYDPDDPADSVLQRAPRDTPGAGPLAIAFLVIGAVVGVVVVVVRARRAAPAADSDQRS